MSYSKQEREAISYGWRWFWITVSLFVLIGIASFIISNISKSANSVANVIHDEFDAGPLLEKYRYFKRVAASIEAKEADIMVIESRVKRLIPMNLVIPLSRKTLLPDIRWTILQEA